jgi:glycosyltransferase involved in cell wall biosynthesis
MPARLVLVGEGPERVAAEDRAEELGLRGSTCFLGRRLDFVEHLRHADAFLMTSECESFGVAALEALGAGVPVFAYRVGGLPELVVDGVGRLAEPFDVEALAAGIVAVLSHPEEREALGRAARAHALSRYRTEPALDRYEQIYRRIAARRRTES